MVEKHGGPLAWQWHFVGKNLTVLVSDDGTLRTEKVSVKSKAQQMGPSGVQFGTADPRTACDLVPHIHIPVVVCNISIIILRCCDADSQPDCADKGAHVTAGGGRRERESRRGAERRA